MSSMASSSTSTSDPSLPTLPIELKREILRFCDPSTLASTSRVSLAFLELSSPLLYREAAVEGFDGLRRLFCESNPSQRQPTLERYLDLHQIRSLTFVARDPQEESLDLFEDRLTSSYPSKSSTIASILSSIETVTLKSFQFEPFSTEEPFDFPILLDLLNLSHLHIHGTSPSMLPEDSFANIELPFSFPAPSFPSSQFHVELVSPSRLSLGRSRCSEELQGRRGRV